MPAQIVPLIVGEYHLVMYSTVITSNSSSSGFNVEDRAKVLISFTCLLNCLRSTMCTLFALKVPQRTNHLEITLYILSDSYFLSESTYFAS
jgi:hypothetical protein